MFSNLQKLRYLTYNSYKFKDSLEHLPSSLSKLVTELNNPYQKHTFPIFHRSQIIQSFFKNDESKDSIKTKNKIVDRRKGSLSILTM